MFKKIGKKRIKKKNNEKKIVETVRIIEKERRKFIEAGQWREKSTKIKIKKDLLRKKGSRRIQNEK